MNLLIRCCKHKWSQKGYIHNMFIITNMFENQRSTFRRSSVLALTLYDF